MTISSGINIEMPKSEFYLDSFVMMYIYKYLALNVLTRVITKFSGKVRTVKDVYENTSS